MFGIPSYYYLDAYERPILDGSRTFRCTGTFQCEMLWCKHSGAPTFSYANFSANGFVRLFVWNFRQLIICVGIRLWMTVCALIASFVFILWKFSVRIWDFLELYLITPLGNTNYYVSYFFLGARARVKKVTKRAASCRLVWRLASAQKEIFNDVTAHIMLHWRRKGQIMQLLKLYAVVHETLCKWAEETVFIKTCNK